MPRINAMPMRQMIIVIRRMKASPKGFMATARTGLMTPKMIATAIPAVTCSQSDEYQRRVRGGGEVTSVAVVTFSASLQSRSASPLRDSRRRLSPHVSL